MRYVFYILPLLVMFAVTCKKNDPEPEPAPAPAPTPAPVADTTRPIIVLNGNVFDTVSVGASYTDPGATATDNVDGNITNNIVVSGTVNTSTAANYTLNYNVSDLAGNNAHQKSRFINVKPLPPSLAGNYSVACTCSTLDPGTSAPVTANTSYTASVSVSATNTNIFSLSALRVGSVTPSLNNVNTYGGNTFGFNMGNINPSGLQMNSGLGVNNGGTINPAKTSMTITSGFSVIMYPNMSYTCTNIYTKF